MLDLLRNYANGQTLDVHIAKAFDTDADVEGISKGLLASSLFMAPSATFLRRMTDPAMDEKKYSSPIRRMSQCIHYRRLTTRRIVAEQV